MAGDGLLKPTIHIEVLVREDDLSQQIHQEVRQEVAQRLQDSYVAVQVGQAMEELKGGSNEAHIAGVEIVDYTGPEVSTDVHGLEDVQLDVQTYVLKDTERHRQIQQPGEDDACQTRVFALPNAALHDEWNSLIFEDALPTRMLRYLVRMMGLLRQPGLNLSTFNWNRVCLLHGPPGSGKSTLCRALAQKLSIRLGATFSESFLVEINANAMLSKYFGESGKQINATFNGVASMAQDSKRLVCVVIDEVETIATSRQKLSSNNECHDGLRATNQLLTALDQLRCLPNVLVLCTSNLLEAIDPAFLDRVDIKQLIPSPSPAATYNIFRSCLNELVKSSLVDSTSHQLDSTTAAQPESPAKSTTRSNRRSSRTGSPSTSPEPWTVLSSPTIPTFSVMWTHELAEPTSPGSRVWAIAQRCHGLSGRTLRRLPLLGMAMYTWGGQSSLQDAVSALEAAVDQELLATKAGQVACAGECLNRAAPEAEAADDHDV